MKKITAVWEMVSLISRKKTDVSEVHTASIMGAMP
jgi:hypothetical protein